MWEWLHERTKAHTTGSARQELPEKLDWGTVTHLLQVPARRSVDSSISWLVRGSFTGIARQILLPDGAMVLIFNLRIPQRLCDRHDLRDKEYQDAVGLDRGREARELRTFGWQ